MSYKNLALALLFVKFTLDKRAVFDYYIAQEPKIPKCYDGVKHSLMKASESRRLVQAGAPWRCSLAPEQSA